jgi:hypothetical protein
MVTENGKPAMKLVVPWGAYGTPLVTIRVPTELADTWVDRPSMIHAEPTGYWESTGTKYVEISGSQRLFVDVKSFETTVTGSTNVRVACDHPRVGLHPLEQTVTLAPGETKTVSFTVTNQGVETQVNNVPITITCHETYAGAETGRDTVYATLLQTLGHDSTYLNILAVEKGTVKPVAGAQVQVLYGTEQKVGFTSTTGKVSFTLDVAGGAGYAGQIQIQSADTAKYLAAHMTVSVQPGINDVTLEVPVKGVEYPDDWLILLILAAVIAIIAIAVAANIAYRKRKGKPSLKIKRRRRKP